VYELQAGIDLTFCVLPKSPRLFNPSKRTFDNPALWHDGKGMQLIAFGHLHRSAELLLYGIGKGLPAVAAVDEQTTDFIQTGCAPLYGLQSPRSIRHFSGCHRNGMWQALCIHCNMSLDP